MVVYFKREHILGVEVDYFLEVAICPATVWHSYELRFCPSGGVCAELTGELEKPARGILAPLSYIKPRMNRFPPTIHGHAERRVEGQMLND